MRALAVLGLLLLVVAAVLFVIYLIGRSETKRQDRERAIQDRMLSPGSVDEMRRIGSAMSDLMYEATVDPMFSASPEFRDRARKLRGEWRGDSDQ